MLSREGKENDEKTTIGLISKKLLCTCSTLFCTFLCLCFARLQRETFINFPVTRFMEEMPLILPLIFTLVAASISHFPTAATKFSRCSSNAKMSPLSFISPSSCLSLFFSLSFAGLSPTFSFSLSLPFCALQICGHDN